MSCKYIFLNESRDYSHYQIVPSKDVEYPFNLESFNPAIHGLFHNDIFEYDDTIDNHNSNHNNNHKCSIIHSPVRNNKYICGILIIEGNRTYGTHNKKSLFKCIPDDSHLPIFLVPYEMKKMGFFKNIANIYVTFEFHEWTGKHPIGKITQNLGAIDVVNHFFEYQLYCKNLHHSIQSFNAKTIQSIESKKQTSHSNDLVNNMIRQYNITDQRYIESGWYIFSIDPLSSTDFDDAFSIKQLENDEILISIYISNVPIWLDYLDLWDYLSKRVSTIYLPDKKRPMLPPILSDTWCSLCQQQKRIAFCLDLVIKQSEIVSSRFTNAVIEISRNFRYEEKALLYNLHYMFLKNVVSHLYQTKKHSFLTKINDSHEVVSNLMLLINVYSANNLMSFNCGIFRSASLSSSPSSPSSPSPSSPSSPSLKKENVPNELSSFLAFWHNTSGSYQAININTNNNHLKHSILEVDYYVHISSPIRRIVDVLNMIQFFKYNNILSLSTNALQFYQDWLNNLDHINTSMRSIRKLQSDCELLYLVNQDEKILKKQYKGFCIDKLHESSCYGIFQYIIYLPELKLTTRLFSQEELELYQENKYSLYSFKNESNFKRKIRIQLAH